MEERINRIKWIKTTHIQPHEYILRKDHPDLYSEISKMIKEKGYTKDFRGTKYRYVDIGEYKYWCMGIILNREKKK